MTNEKEKQKQKQHTKLAMRKHVLYARFKVFIVLCIAPAQKHWQPDDKN